MKVYELIAELAKMPAGSVVKIQMIKSLSELPVFDGKDRTIDFVVREVTEDDGIVSIDGWAE
jgi:hypothetical protein